jgi:hypothetical protein
LVLLLLLLLLLLLRLWHPGCGGYAPTASASSRQHASCLELLSHLALLCTQQNQRILPSGVFGFCALSAHCTAQCSTLTPH